MVDRLTVLDRTLRLLGEMVDAGAGEISASLANCRVLVRCAEPFDAPTQAALATIVTLAVRSGLQLHLDLPEASTTTPLLEPGLVSEGLVHLGEAVVPGSVITTPIDSPDLQIAIGASARPTACRTLHLGVPGQVASFAGQPVAWTPLDPIGAIAAAGLAAGEAVRHAIRRLPPAAVWAEDILRPVDSASFTVPALPGGWINLGAIDVISAGAITDAAMWTLRARGEILGHGRVFDDGRYDLTNLNRYVELDRGAAEREVLKAEQLARSTPSGLALEPITRRFDLSDVAGAAPTIMVGADDVGVRWLAQRASPTWLGIGATSHNEARVTEHRPDGPCAGCAHPYLGIAPSQPIPTCAPVSFWAGFVLALRLLRATTAEATSATDTYATYYPLTRPGIGHVGGCPYHPACPIDPRHRRVA